MEYYIQTSFPNAIGKIFLQFNDPIYEGEGITYKNSVQCERDCQYKSRSLHFLLCGKHKQKKPIKMDQNSQTVTQNNYYLADLEQSLIESLDLKNPPNDDHDHISTLYHSSFTFNLGTNERPTKNYLTSKCGICILLSEV